MEYGRESIAVMDIGNSRVKILYRDETKSFEAGESPGEIVGCYFGELGIAPKMFGISYVNEPAYLRIVEYLNEAGIPYIDIFDLLERQKLIDFTGIKGMGEDRALGLIGALENYKPPFITIDCGTALTINYIDKDYVCRGGAILPGPYTQLISLTSNTYALNSRDLSFNDDIFGDNTDDAISNGILYGIAGGIANIAEIMRSALNEDQEAKAIVSGGAVEILKPALNAVNFKYDIDDRLVLNGIFRLMDEYYKENANSDLLNGIKE